MLEPDTVFQVRSEETAAKVFDGEAILINLATGMYYSLDGAGGLVWSLIEGGNELQTIIREVCGRYDVAVETAAADVRTLVDRLVSESLVSVSSANGTAAVPPADPPARKAPYAPPALHVYDDMSALLALDPPMPGFMDSTWDGPGD